MDTAVLITLIIVGGVVVISVAGIAWLWYATARGMTSMFRGGADALAGRIDSIEREVQSLRQDVDALKGRPAR